MIRLFKNKKQPRLKESRSLRRERLHEVSRNPFMDWAIIFTIGAAIAVALAVSGAFYLESAANSLTGTAPMAPSTEANATIDTTALSKVLGGFDARAAERTSLLQGYSGSKDPSI